MKYIIVRGNTNSGKQTTIKEICRRLKPEKIMRIGVSDGLLLEVHNIFTVDNMQDKTYLLYIKGKKVLVVAGSPTRQQLNVSRLINAINTAQIIVDLAIVAVNTFEKLKGFSTNVELAEVGSQVTDVKVQFIPSHQFVTTAEWKKRIAYLTTVTKYYL
jgi:hypothetical protein